MNGRVAWERHMAHGAVHRSRVHRVTEELPNHAFCGYGVPHDIIDVLYRDGQIPDDIEDCGVCAALDDSGVVPVELAA